MPKASPLISLLCLIVFATSHAKANIVENNYAISIYDMGKLISHEHYLLNILQNFTDLLQEKVDTIENYLEMMNYEEDVKPPNNAVEYFRLIRRLHLDYFNWVWFLEQQPWEVLVAHIIAIAPHMPSVKDIREATRAIRLIQIVYSLPTDKMVAGILMDVHYNASLNPMECYTIANELFKDREYEAAMEWLSSGVDMYNADTDKEELYTQLGVPLSNFYELFVKIQDAQGKRGYALTELKTAMKTWPEQVSFRRAHSRLKMNIRIDKEPNTKKARPEYVYAHCCSHECRPTSKLFCLYNSTTSSFLRLAPLKMELLSLDPYVVLYHDVVTEEDVERIKILAQDDLTRATTVHEDQVLREDPYRTTKAKWLDDTDEVMQRVSRLIQDMTNFDLNGSDMFQVMNYGIGGFYGNHYDFLRNSKSPKNFVDRIATTMFYLSDVPLGGATAFPVLKLSVFPKKGSALMWYNLHHSGEGDKRTFHSACPTIVGSRWVMTRWIGEIQQLFRRPCLTHI
ncbi:prolyl 4-hydroxylase subunit alpha-2 [Drosophila elegans]|uniref:prolyl 4-hydroxylase subunit alpha-2 n=1 Tax=Drosophila elegans TaxID=30023 RepID=UPI0007E7D7E5|nr:prolyl 4-hydroxylase subunit alpha-2 [Drosophila elegans]